MSFAAVVVGQRKKKFCIRGLSRSRQLVVLADHGHVRTALVASVRYRPFETLTAALSIESVS